ncbi:hypothetical protein ACFO5Q_02320 [Kordiimonas lipolytica]|uniref:Uncharacterized protein n=1 Tax=Kordiimonas lipolytica TaxID=1662421 RepID=A0ABV8U724_9PROT|nr:hypothetical protein [Kordiimonas lipolytica]
MVKWKTNAGVFFQVIACCVLAYAGYTAYFLDPHVWECGKLAGLAVFLIYPLTIFAIVLFWLGKRLKEIRVLISPFWVITSIVLATPVFVDLYGYEGPGCELSDEAEAGQV